MLTITWLQSKSQASIFSKISLDLLAACLAAFARAQDKVHKSLYVDLNTYKGCRPACQQTSLTTPNSTSESWNGRLNMLVLLLVRWGIALRPGFHTEDLGCDEVSLGLRFFSGPKFTAHKKNTQLFVGKKHEPSCILQDVVPDVHSTALDIRRSSQKLTFQGQ